jgi:hypothetical protein
MYIGELHRRILSGHPLTVGDDLKDFAINLRAAGFTNVEIDLETGWEAGEGDHLVVRADPPDDERYAHYIDSERGGSLWEYLA